MLTNLEAMSQIPLGPSMEIIEKTVKCSETMMPVASSTGKTVHPNERTNHLAHTLFCTIKRKVWPSAVPETESSQAKTEDDIKERPPDLAEKKILVN